jgi:hypothetical protein
VVILLVCPTTSIKPCCLSVVAVSMIANVPMIDVSKDFIAHITTFLIAQKWFIGRHPLFIRNLILFDGYQE